MPYVVLEMPHYADCLRDTQSTAFLANTLAICIDHTPLSSGGLLARKNIKAYSKYQASKKYTAEKAHPSYVRKRANFSLKSLVSTER